jgi:hypothetical protein
MENSSKKIPS